MERIKNLAKCIYGKCYTILHTPCKSYKSIGSFVKISRRYILLNGTEYLCIGNYVKILDNARIEVFSKFNNCCFTPPNLVIEDRVMINQNFHCTCASSVQSGENTVITEKCGIFDIIHPYEDVTIAPKDQPIQTKPVYIGKNCMIGMNSVIQPGVILGNHVIVGSNSTVLSGEYPSFCVLVGSPAHIIKRYNPKSQQWEKTDKQGNFL